MTITSDILKQIAPGSKKTNYKLLPELAEWMTFYFPQFEIDQKAEACHFIAQAAHETDSFNSLEEYASGKAYDTRVDLGNTPQADGDGELFKGRGIYMTTGRSNYKVATVKWNEHNSPKVDFVKNPKLLMEPRYAVWSACMYWQQKDFNTFANLSDNAKINVKIRKAMRVVTPIEYITLRINGGFNHLKERKQFYERAKAIIK